MTASLGAPGVRAILPQCAARGHLFPMINSNPTVVPEIAGVNVANSATGWRGIGVSRHIERYISSRVVSTACVLIFAVVALSGCSFPDLISSRPATPPPTRTPLPSFTPAGESALVTVTPAIDQTPGVIVVPPGVDPRTLIPLPPTATGTATATSTSTPITTMTPSPTPLPDAGLQPGDGSPTPVSPLATPLPTATASATATPSATDTSMPEPSPTFTHTPTPFVQVASGLVNLRAGPGIDYPLVAQLGPDIPVAVVGQNPQGTWFQICCVNGESVWVAKTSIQAVNDTTDVTLVLPNPPPAPTMTSTPSPTPTITPTPTVTPYPFQVSWGPLYFPTNNELLSIWAKIAGPAGEPLAGYYLQVEFRNREDGSSFQDRPNTKGEQPSTDDYQFNVPPGTASGNRVEYNYKYEFIAPDPAAEDPATTETRLTLIDGYWRMYVVDGAGRQLSDAVEFNTLLGNNNREVYVAWTLSP